MKAAGPTKNRMTWEKVDLLGRLRYLPRNQKGSSCPGRVNMLAKAWPCRWFYANQRDFRYDEWVMLKSRFFMQGVYKRPAMARKAGR